MARAPRLDDQPADRGAARPGRLEVQPGHARRPRARQINSYFNQLGDGLGHDGAAAGHSVARKPLSIGFEEIAADKIDAGRPLPDELDADERRGLSAAGCPRPSTP